MRFRLLGQLQVRHDADWSTIRGAQPRVVLTVLLTEAGRVVSADRLLDEIWGDRPPRTALNTVQGYVTRLRRLLGDDPEVRLVTTDRGYQLVVADDQVDSRVFEQLVESGLRLLLDGRTADGAEQLAAALALWQGPAMSDVPPSPAVTSEAGRLEQRRLTAEEARLGAELALGRHAETADELHRLVAEYPLREQLRCHLMLALYRCGRRAEALDVYRHGRAVLVGELGMEPGPELRELERAILADDHSLALTTESAPVLTRVTPAQVPADVAGFTGRDSILRQLDDLLPPAGGERGAVRIVTITGTPGVGKTALAVHWAHRVRDRFGDGQLYVNLRGHAHGQPLRPVDALARFLHALGVPAEQVPTDVEEAASLYRSLLADRRMLVLLDDAHHPDQVRPLLPGVPGCLVLVTSRNTMRGLVARDGAHGLPLDVLTTQEAHALLTRVLGAGRVRAEPDAAAELAALCAHLPLALRIAAANLAVNPHQPIAGYTDLLRAGDRLGTLQVDGDEQAAVRATFGLSYAALPDDTRRMFRLLGLVPCPDVTAPAAAALTAIPTRDAERLLARLAEAHLLNQHTAGRCGYHDLLRLYASERSEDEDGERERDIAVRRLYDWYLYTVDAAATLLYPQMRRLTLSPAETPQPTAFADHTEALAWLDAERHNLVAAITHPTRHQPLPVVATLADALRGYFWLRMYTVDWLAVAHAGLAAADTVNDPAARTAALLSIADVHYRRGQYQRATDYSTRALATSQKSGWPEGQAAAHNNLGNLAWKSGQLSRAAEHHRSALALNQQAGKLTGQVNNLGNLGSVYRHLGRLQDALATYTEALAISRKLASSHGEAVNLGALGAVTHDLGQLDEAVDYLVKALRMNREVGDRGGEVDTRNELAAVHGDAGRCPQALEHAETALTLARDTAYRQGEINVRNTLGAIHRRLGHLDDAIDQHQRALALAEDSAYRFGEARALIGLAAARHDPADAEAAIEVSGTVGYRVLEGQARTVLAAILLDQDRVDAVGDVADRALAMHRGTGHRLGEAGTLIILGDLADRTGHGDRARAHRHSADALLADIGAAWIENGAAVGPMAET